MSTEHAPQKPAEAIIRLQGVCRHFGPFTAVDNVSLDIRRGEVFGLIGHNGAGKSTLFKIMLGLLAPSSGHIQIAGVPDRHEPDTGEVNYPHLFRLLDDLGYDGWIGCEYRPTRGQAPHATRDGLGWMAAWL